MSEVRLIPLGVGEAFTASHYTTCLALGVDDAWLLIECPHPIRKMLREATTAAGLPFDLDRVEAIAVSHLHADHCSGLEDFGYYTYFALGRRARLAMHPDVSAKLWNGLLAAGMAEVQMEPDGPTIRKQLDDYFDLIALNTAGPVSVGPFTIECRRTIHPVPTTAFRIRAGGRTLAFSADTAFDPTLIDWLAPADLIVHEVTLIGHSGVHTPYEKLVALPADLRNKIRLIHYPDDFDLAASVIEPLYQGRSYVV
ncbi:Ribonuclease BN, tRNA processing enzyme [Singulisphaera sp. GP187]|uniref:MBL fold metallo-hydrolase n=1 Tax=Singulisphaera sp. GP187 TaxID=1882752 RepID=UPI000928ACEB|nr:MBL fold metallo-hydrolase [Singulisphaera sp. GP187]SIO40102.1 Ribonuclease BN, tRNA processing enzyme [Singulisphaera sp. GP187]